MPAIQFRQKTPGELVCIIDEAGLSPVAKAILEGFETHIGECLGRVLGVHDIAPDDWLRQAGLLDEIGERLRSGEPPPEATETDLFPTLIYPLDSAYWFSMAALDFLDEDVTQAIRLHSISVEFLARFESSLIWIEKLSGLDGEGSGGTINPAVIGALGAQVRWEPRNKTMEFALKKYGERKWKSRADGVRKILPDVCEKAKEFGFSYADSNIERTITDWIRGSSTSSS